MLFKDISYLQFWRPFCLAQWDRLCNFRSGYYEKHFSEIILNLDKWFRRRCHSKIFLNYSSGAILLNRVGPFVKF